jgi:hypothetical protein
MGNRTNLMSLMRLAVTLLILITFGLASFGKWMDGSAPQWFIDQFSKTWMGSMPQTPMYLGIAIIEGLLAVGALVSLVKLEWLRPPAEILRWTLVGALFMFIMLGFGARLSGQFIDAASHFMYFSGTLLMLFVIDRDDQDRAT